MPSYLAGIRKTDRLHMGHYFSFIKPLVDIIKKDIKAEICILYCDMYEPMLSKNIKKDFEKFRDFVCKFFPQGYLNKSLFVLLQSDYKKPILEKYFELQQVVPIGYLQRMTQFQQKSQNLESIPTSLLTYPLLMTADLLQLAYLFGSKQEYNVVVGKDQVQHIRYSNDFAKMHHKVYGSESDVPSEFKIYLDGGTTIKDLQNPLVKMSKSSVSDLGTLWLDDSHKEIDKKIMKACTNEEGLLNLLTIHNLLNSENKLYYDDIKNNCSLLKSKISDLLKIICID